MRFKPTNVLNPNCFQAGLYGRLSDEDRGKVNKFMESESIQNQRDYLHYTVKQLNMAVDAIPVEIYGEYYDDDYTGITFDRPNFQRMMRELEAGRIDCIIVKDFSRFGRDYIRIIRYLEKDFEQKNHQIRFVAYSDHYDSLTDKPDIGVRILLFLNEEYSRSQSHKVTTGMESMMRAGKFIGAFAPYGYQKDPKDKHHLIIDRQACETVREIYRMNLKEGLGATEIARRLNEKGIDSPMIYKEKNGMNYQCGRKLSPPFCWTADTVNRILQDEKYTGTMVQHKSRTKDFKRKEMEQVSKEDWIRVPGMQEAIISEEDFNAVQQLHKDIPKNKNKTGETSIFAGVLKCGDCFHTLIKHSEHYKGTVYHSHQCKTHKRDSSKCYPNRIYDNALAELILGDINKIISSVKNLDKIRAEYRSEAALNRRRALQYNLDKRMEEGRKQQLLIENLQEKWLLGKLNDEEYEQLAIKYKREAQRLKDEAAELKNALDHMEDNYSDSWIKSLSEQGFVDKLTREIITEAVESIYVYHNNTLVINYKFTKQLQEL